MKKLFYPESIAIFGLSAKANNIPRLILENLLRWGYRGRLFGINPKSTDMHVDGIKMYQDIEQLPVIPDLAVTLIPARFIPDTVEKCGKAGVRWLAIPSGGFNELGEEGERLAAKTLENAKKYNIRFIGPNALTVANTANGLCLPFPPLYSPPKGHLSLITQSGGVGLILWNLMKDENIGMAKFASIGNKLDLTEVEFLEYLGQDPETKVICMYLESVPNGRELIEVAAGIDKPVVIYKSNTTDAGKRMAMSHTAAISNDEDIIDSAFERAGIIRIRRFTDFISVTKAFRLPPMQGNRVMAMTPAGGFAVMMADLLDKMEFEFANPGQEFYESLKKYTNANVINFSNPLDMGDIYDPKMSMEIFFYAIHNENVDAAVYVSQWPQMPRGDDVFFKMFQTDLSKETFGAILSSGKPMCVCLFGESKTITRIKQNINIPLFNSAEEMIFALKKQKDFYAKKKAGPFVTVAPDDIDFEKARTWVDNNTGIIGEEADVLLKAFNINVPATCHITAKDQIAEAEQSVGYPVVMKVVSKDAIHKTEAGGVMVNIKSKPEAENAFDTIQTNFFNYKKDGEFQGVRMSRMADDGLDMFVGGKVDEAFGPVLFFGYGGIHVEIFKDVQTVLCPSNHEEVHEKIKRLKTYHMLSGARGKKPFDVDAYVDAIVRVSHLMAKFETIAELDINPLRVFEKGKGVMTLDIRLRIDKQP